MILEFRMDRVPRTATREQWYGIWREQRLLNRRLTAWGEGIREQIAVSEPFDDPTKNNKPVAVSENQCKICANVPSSCRALFRLAILSLPVREQICDECTEAFWKNTLFAHSEKNNRTGTDDPPS